MGCFARTCGMTLDERKQLAEDLVSCENFEKHEANRLAVIAESERVVNLIAETEALLKSLKNKEICGSCGKMAQWCYMPGYGNGESPYSCDDCVTSVDYDGCSCNWHYLQYEQPGGIEGKDFRFIIREGITKEDGIWINLDKQGRPYPCAEYCFDEEGFDKD